MNDFGRPWCWAVLSCLVPGAGAGEYWPRVLEAGGGWIWALG